MMSPSTQSLRRLAAPSIAALLLLPALADASPASPQVLFHPARQDYSFGITGKFDFGDLNGDGILDMVAPHDNAIAAMEKFATIAELMGEDISHMSLRAAARRAPAAIRELIEDLGLPLGLRAIDVDDLTKVKQLVNRPGWDASSPRPAGPDDFDLLLEACMEPAMSYWELGGH